ncbi:geranylgeranyl diphosphate synthase, type II [Flexibacter flexilis DSM 6793]|uniref:Geranylgeranyl diphosphate synthase, type II n=1 Tax=Flexibacter flexilis DSM 6793 TaxID=927664 RepID=A0A1I1G3U6_9BACT|nr:polyprenyl synthetase family protein [Flexibacter flexilis]SFC06417.1 geranylgeranyl diphosphate synthase, type II [Flexibacter flexilis DSM 6793]
MTTPKLSFQPLLDQLEQSFQGLEYGQNPPELYEPIRYLMNLGGKRLRPLLTLLSYRLWEKDYKTVLMPAMAVEVFHNFTLMHDDIMDNAPLRRGKATVHEHWNTNVAILSGDVMLVKAYEMMLHLPANQLHKALTLFSKCAAEVCEGQQLDMNFEHKASVSQAEYIEMIRLKTAVLLGFSLELGALAAGASEQDQIRMREFGTLIGIGFQLTDDLLDVYGDSAKFGKFVGGDIVANKKTFLLLEALNTADPTQKQTLTHWLTLQNFEKNEKVAAVTDIYNQLNIKEKTQEKIQFYFDAGFAALAQVQVADVAKQELLDFVQWLMGREK